MPYRMSRTSFRPTRTKMRKRFRLARLQRKEKKLRSTLFTRTVMGKHKMEKRMEKGMPMMTMTTRARKMSMSHGL